MPLLVSSSDPDPDPEISPGFCCCISLCFLLIRKRSTAVIPSTGGRGNDADADADADVDADVDVEAEKEVCAYADADADVDVDGTYISLPLVLDSMRIRLVGVVFSFVLVIDSAFTCILLGPESEALALVLLLPLLLPLLLLSFSLARTCALHSSSIVLRSFLSSPAAVEEEESKSKDLSREAEVMVEAELPTPNDTRRFEVDGDGLRMFVRLVSRRMFPPNDLRPLLILVCFNVVMLLSLSILMMVSRTRSSRRDQIMIGGRW